jgi:hypothetical protein
MLILSIIMAEAPLSHELAQSMGPVKVALVDLKISSILLEHS